VPAAAPLRPGLAPRLFDQDVAHGTGGGEEEVLPALPAHGAVAGDPQIGLVDQGSGLEGLTRRLVGQLLGGELAQLVVDERQQFGRRLSVPGLRRLKHGRRLGFVREGHRPPTTREQPVERFRNCKPPGA
jgi:hypothetical protein